MDQEKSPQSPPILVVDDDRDFLKSIEFTLLSKGITNVECCMDSRKVMPLLEKEKFSLILLDMLMPGISGIELLPQILEAYPETPVVVITAYNDINTAIDCMKKGAFDYLLKPFENFQLVKIVRRTLDKTGGRKTNFRLREFLLFEILKNPESFGEIITDIQEMQNFYILKTSEIFLQMGKTNLVINTIGRLLANEQINKYNIDLFYVLGEAYEKSEDFMKAVGLYRDIMNFDPQYPGIQQKVDKIEKLKENIILDIS